MVRPEATTARREAILAAALRLFTKKGYSDTSIHDLRMTSGASVGSIYHHFGGKAGVAAASNTRGRTNFKIFINGCSVVLFSSMQNRRGQSFVNHCPM